MTACGAVDGEELLMHDWRVDRLTRLGVPVSLAEVYPRGPGPRRAPGALQKVAMEQDAVLARGAARGRGAAAGGHK